MAERGIEPLGEVLARFGDTHDDLVAADDPKRHFHGMYLRTTEAVADELRRGGFEDPAWVAEWDVTFADLYLGALDRWQRGERVPMPWRLTFQAADDPSLAPLHHELLGMNAHINYDLPQALIATIDADQFCDPDLMVRRHADYRRIDDLVVGRVREEYRELRQAERPGDRSIIDRLLYPVNKLATQRLLRESRDKVWHNAGELDAARRRGEEPLRDRVRELEDLSSAKVSELVTSGQVLVHLALRGFGVVLPPPEGRPSR